MRSRRLMYLAATGISITLLTTACGGDGQSGIPTDTPDAPATAAPATSSSATASTPTATATTSAQLGVGTTIADPPEAVKAWANDVLAGEISLLRSRCWMVPPTEVASKYGDQVSILRALANPGIVGDRSISWSDAATTLTFNRTDIARGYACPATTAPLTDTDSAYAVTRYLSRAIGEPIDPADVEASYPLVCAPTPTWDPNGTGMPIVPPLATNKTVLDASIAFDSRNIAVTPVRANYVTATVDVTDPAGTVVTRTLTLDQRGSGYCIGEVA